MTITQFFSMGGYGFYVWSAYGIGFSVLLFLKLRADSHFKKTKASLKIKASH